MQRMTTAVAAVAMVAGIGLAGCGGGDKSKTDKGGYERVVQSADQLRVGMTRDEVTQSMKGANLISMGSSMMGGAAVEEVKLESYYDDNWNKTKELYVRFLYFVDKTLVDISNQRIDFRSNPDIVTRWSGGPAK